MVDFFIFLFLIFIIFVLILLIFNPAYVFTAVN